ncbi:MAG: L-histidine N(alpha)-methyltransferase, partial [Candidatus Binatia bacterium]
MQKQNKPTILSPSQRNPWRSTEPSIWTLDTDHLNQDPALSILRTLLDQPRWLEAHHLYDELGSQLFEQICELPEYYLTRT